MRWLTYGKARYAFNQPVVDALIAYCRAEQLANASELARRIYGVKASGAPKQTAASYAYLAGAARPAEKSVERIKQAIGVDLAEAVKEAEALEKGQGPQENLPVLHQGKPSARQALAEFRETGAQSEAMRVKPGPPRFAMVIQQDGTASVTVNLVDASEDKALRVLAALQVAGVVRGG